MLYLGMEQSPASASNSIIPVAIVPRQEMTVMQLEMRKILVAENRADEIAIVTPTKAPELLAVFNRGYLDATNLYSKLKLEQARAEDEVNKVRASILIDKIPGLLKEKGLTSSADMRQALVDADPEYQEARERLSFIEATLEYMKGKMKFLENAYTSVKKIMDTGNWNMELQGGRRQTSAGAEDVTPVGKVSRFGNPK